MAERRGGLGSGPLVIGIETSCDETGVGVVAGQTLLANALASSVEEHARYGGVVPEVASRAHLEAMVPTVSRALAEAGVTLADVDAISVTAGPGLAGALMVGVAAAKAYAVAAGKPLYGVNHLAAHVAVDTLEHGPLPSPAVALLVSGGHSSLLRVDDLTGMVRPLGRTLDDAAGEAFDKVARLLGLGFPGGPAIDRVAREADEQATPRGLAGQASVRAGQEPAPPGQASESIVFPRGLTTPAELREHPYDFSFSGLKTAVARWVRDREQQGQRVPVPKVAAAFQESVADVLTRKAVAACLDHGVEHLIIGGGVAANSRLRAMAEQRCEAAGLRLRVPRPGLCTDNGAMVAALGSSLVTAGRPPSPLDLPADSSMPLTTIVW